MTDRIISSVLVATLLAAGVWTASTVSMTSDLARFMPDPERADERVLVEQLSNAPGARILMLAITSHKPDRANSAALLLLQNAKQDLVVILGRDIFSKKVELKKRSAT